MLSFRLPENVADAWTKAAEKSEMSLADFIRSQVKVDGVDLPAPRRKTPARKMKYLPADPALVRQVARIGNNLNQIARAVNQQGVINHELELLRMLESIKEEVKKAVNSDECT